MKRTGYILLVSCLGYMLSACGIDNPPPPQVVRIISSDFCALVKPEDVTWSVDDTQASIDNLRRLGAKRQSRCEKKPTKPTS